jgi:hypothetical protein
MERYRPVPGKNSPRQCGRTDGRFGTYQLHLPADVVVDVECAVRLMVLGSQPGPAVQLAALLWDTGR